MKQNRLIRYTIWGILIICPWILTSCDMFHEDLPECRLFVKFTPWRCFFCIFALAMIDQPTIDRILDAAQIVDVVSEFVTLRKRGVCP